MEQLFESMPCLCQVLRPVNGNGMLGKSDLSVIIRKMPGFGLGCDWIALFSLSARGMRQETSRFA